MTGLEPVTTWYMTKYSTNWITPISLSVINLYKERFYYLFVCFAKVRPFFEITKFFINFFHFSFVFNVSLRFYTKRKPWFQLFVGVSFKAFREIYIEFKTDCLCYHPKFCFISLIHLFIPPLFSLLYQKCFSSDCNVHGKYWGTNCSVPLLIKPYVLSKLNIL